MTPVFVYGQAGKPWKVWLGDTRTDVMPDGERITTGAGIAGVDLQFGIATFFVRLLASEDANKGKWKYEDFTPARLLTKARR